MIDAAPRWTLHDIRRTVASGMAPLGINLPVIEKVLNHASPGLQCNALLAGKLVALIDANNAPGTLLWLTVVRDQKKPSTSS